MASLRMQRVRELLKREIGEAIRREFPDAVFFYARLGRSIHKVLMDDEGIRTEPRNSYPA